MPLIVGATPYSPWQSLKPLLQHLGWQDQTIDLTPDASSTGAAHLSKLDADSREKGCYLLLHARPELAIARAMDEGKDPDTALDEWRSAAEQLLAFYKQNRHHAAVVEITSACEHPQRLIEWLAQNHSAFEFVDQTGLGLVEALSALEVDAGSLNLLLAAQWVSQNDALTPLLAQLEAASIPLNEEGYQPPRVDLAALYQYLDEQSSAHQTASEEEAEAQQNELKEENELILKQLFQVQEELERYYIKNQELIAETNNQKEQITTKNEKLRHFSQENKELHELLKRSQEVIKELKKSNIRNSPIKALTQSFRKASRSNRLLEEQIRLVEESDLFDAEWYLLHNPDVAAKYPNPAEHFVCHGGQEGRAPGPNFSSKAYLSKYPDVAESGQNPLVHYLQHGQQEGRKP